MRNIYSVFAVIVAIVLMVSTRDPKYSLLYLLPLIYGILYSFSHFLQKNKFQSIVLAILFATSYVRYVIAPFVLFLGGFENNASEYHVSLFHQAILLQSYEEIVFFITIAYFAPKIYKGTTNSVDYSNKQIGKDIGIWGLLILSVVLIITIPGIISRYHLVLSLTGGEVETDNSDLSGAFGIIVSTARYLLVLLLLLFAYKKYNVTQKNKYIVLSLIVVVVNSLVVYDLSRFGLIIPAAAFVYYLAQLYPSKKKSILRSAIILIGIVVLYTSFIKMFSEARGGADMQGESGYWGSALQVYFQGTSDVVIGIAASTKMTLMPLFAFFNDAVANVAVLSRYSVEPLQSIYVFNVEYSGGYAQDKILPNVCAGFNYLGFIGAPLLTVVIMIMGMSFDAKNRRTKDLYMKFVYIYAAITCSFPHMIYYAITISMLVNYAFFMWLFVRINSLLKNK